MAATMNEEPHSLSADVVVVGAGPAGMTAAIAARTGAGVALCEQLDRPGVKLLATGGGRCNLTNTVEPATFMARFGRSGRFLQPALAALDSRGLRDFFAGLGVPTRCEDGLHVYPASNSAATVQKALWQRCRDLRVELLLDTPVRSLWLEGGELKGVVAPRGQISATRVILAGGGRSYPALGGTGGCYELARQAGHEIVPPTPALVPLIAREKWSARCAGVSATARVWIDLPGQARAGRTGPVLFTHTGLSGPAALDLSGDVARLLAKRKDVPLRLDFLTGAAQANGPAVFPLEHWRNAHGRKHIVTILAPLVPRSLAEAICALAEVDPDAPVAGVSSGAERKLSDLLRRLPLTVVATEGLDRAMVTRGGVGLRQVDPHSLQSRLVKGLFFAGELLDLDGPCGGYNLQWAFSSGFLAGKSAAARYTKKTEPQRSQRAQT